MTAMTAVQLTQYSHGGGCGCKIAPRLLAEILGEAQGLPHKAAFEDLLVGTETSDDAAVWRLNDAQAIVATTDFFMPIVDDPVDFGRIAATNALSDVYAMGGRPLFALAIVGMPVDKLSPDIIRRILAGGESVCQAAGIPIAGGHSIDSPEPIYGLVAIGVVHPEKVRRNDQARAGDRLVLGKGLGVGVLSGALKKGALDAAGYATLIDSTTRLNTPGPRLADLPGVRAMTDVTGFGLAGHVLEMARGAGLTARVHTAALPVLSGVWELLAAGHAPGAVERNWASFGHEVVLAAGIDDLHRKLLCDPQTSGGLLVACAPTAVGDVLAVFRDEGFALAAEIGRLEEGPARLLVD